MKKLLVVSCILLCATPAFALTFSEGFEVGSGNNPDYSVWSPDQGFNARSSNSSHVHSGSWGFLVNNSYGTAGHKITAEFGQTIAPTASDPVHVDVWHKAPGTSRRRGGWWIQISMGDVTVPTFGTVLGAPIPAIAIGKPFNDSVALSWFDGKQWTNSGFMDAGDVWYNTSIDISPAGVASLSPATYGPYAVVTQYTGGFDRVSIVEPGTAPSGYWHAIDDLTVTGVPEPAALLLMGIGGLFLRRRVA